MFLGLTLLLQPKGVGHQNPRFLGPIYMPIQNDTAIRFYVWPNWVKVIDYKIQHAWGGVLGAKHFVTPLHMLTVWPRWMLTCYLFVVNNLLSRNPAQNWVSGTCGSDTISTSTTHSIFATFLLMPSFICTASKKIRGNTGVQWHKPVSNFFQIPFPWQCKIIHYLWYLGIILLTYLLTYLHLVPPVSCWTSGNKLSVTHNHVDWHLCQQWWE